MGDHDGSALLETQKYVFVDIEQRHNLITSLSIGGSIHRVLVEPLSRHGMFNAAHIVTTHTYPRGTRLRAYAREIWADHHSHVWRYGPWGTPRLQDSHHPTLPVPFPGKPSVSRTSAGLKICFQDPELGIGNGHDIRPAMRSPRSTMTPLFPKSSGT
ncbi:hypothetical protein ACJQWK_07313 [Exserohilum turcicum]|uniref:Uncharacterized protein n=1 Tax=Exserohilum turcicum (strain 28A) TaxID=671987 RepID=R0IHA4_EXST2|nr:uncharacterized protein SETTUDRAFT_31826 [Exserohilum turcica Et28A]EOA84565.1 hypothetical protein SETTUDRAFT_31826 [Exserohilum turcica Et28A]